MYDDRRIFAAQFSNLTAEESVAVPNEQALSSGQTDNKNIITSVGRWIGNARRRFSQLTNFHEDELYAWLITNKGYGNTKAQVNSEKLFLERLASIVNKRTTFGVLEESLNIQSSIQRSPVEQQYNRQLEEAKQEVLQYDRELKEKIQVLTFQGAADADVARITAPIEWALRRARVRYQGLLARRGDVEVAERREATLFGVRDTKSKKIL